MQWFMIYAKLCTDSHRGHFELPHLCTYAVLSRYFETCKRKPVEKGAGKREKKIHLKNSVTNCRLGSDYKEGAEQVVPQKVVIIGDGHVQSCTTNLKCSLKDNYKVIGYVKPGARSDTLISSAKMDIENLNKKDVIVFWGGTSDVSKNNIQIETTRGLCREKQTYKHCIDECPAQA
jgi:hypothetical protein